MNNEDKKFAPHKAERLLAEDRYKLINPDKIFKEIGLYTGMIVVDIGCGNGFLSIPAAEKVSPNGLVYALDISSKMLDKLKTRKLPSNLKIHLSQEHNFSLETNSIDVALVSVVIHEVENRHKFLLEIRRILKDDGQLWILEWIPKDEEKGPSENHRISLDELINELTLAGFIIKWSDFVGDSHYHLLSIKNIVKCGC